MLGIASLLHLTLSGERLSIYLLGGGARATSSPSFRQASPLASPSYRIRLRILRIITLRIGRILGEIPEPPLPLSLSLPLTLPLLYEYH
jgi:hypothetical protein